MKSMQEILRCDGKFSSRAEYFSGRGAITSDLNYEILTRIKKDIETEHGKEAAIEMVKMVASMESCNATDFINNCYRLERNDFKWTDTKSKKNGNYNEASAMISIFGAMSGQNDRDETPRIRNRFLMDNGIQPQGDRNEMDVIYRGWNY